MIRIIRRLLKLTGRDAFKIKLRFLFGFLESVFSALSLIATFLVPQETDRTGQGSDMVQLSIIGQCLFFLTIGAAGRTVFRYLLFRYQSGIGYGISVKQCLLIGDMLKQVPMGYFNNNYLGEITPVVTTDITFMEVYSMHLLDKVVNGYIAVVLYSPVMLCFDRRIELIFILAILISAFLYRYLQKRGKELTPGRQVARAELVPVVLEYIQKVAAAKAFHMTWTSSKRVHKALEESCLADFKMERTLIPIVTIYDLMFRIASHMILVAAPYFILGDSMTYLVMLLLLIAPFTVFSSIKNMGNMTVQVRMVGASLDRIEAIKDVAVIGGDGGDVGLDRYDIELNHASFSYGQREVIHGISSTIPQGTMTIIVGPSGSEKTTLCNLIAHLRGIQKSEVLVGGVNVKKVTCDSPPCNVSMVSQRVCLFNDTIYNNIQFDRRDASCEQVEGAAKRVCCHSFIMKLSQDYDIVIGEGGSSLSRGEKQRISIAHAILEGVSIVILDEATASIGPENERDIQLAIGELTQGKARIVIAHCLATIQDAGQIPVIDGGRIVQ